MIASYLYDKVKSMNKEKDETNTNVHIIVEKNGKSKKIDYTILSIIMFGFLIHWILTLYNY